MVPQVAPDAIVLFDGAPQYAAREGVRDHLRNPHQGAARASDAQGPSPQQRQ